MTLLTQRIFVARPETVAALGEVGEMAAMASAAIPAGVQGEEERDRVHS